MIIMNIVICMVGIVIYISTAGIFDGKKNTFDESDTPKPTSCYAKSKYEGELYVQKNSNRYLICRAGWMMGGGPNKDKKFIQKIFRQIKEGKKELFIVNDKAGTPTYTHDFANNLKLLLENQKWGLFNMVCSGMIWVDLPRSGSMHVFFPGSRAVGRFLHCSFCIGGAWVYNPSGESGWPCACENAYVSHVAGPFACEHHVVLSLGAVRM